jgi:acetyltransferase-like isoleucine patch superfamily enzyme
MITIGNNVGISNTVIYCVESITIDDNVLIGAGVKIYDTDHHEINSNDRVNKNGNIKVSPILIKKNAFIGAGSMILKGVTIGENSVVGAMSVVTKDIPDNEVWAGNPAVFIRSL